MQRTLNTVSAANNLFIFLQEVVKLRACHRLWGWRTEINELTRKKAGQAGPAEALECPRSGSRTNTPDAEEGGGAAESPSPRPKLPEPTSAHPNREYCFKGCSRHRSSQMSAAC